MAEFIHLKIKRQAGPAKPSYWEEFQVQYKDNMNVVSVLMGIRKNPVNKEGKKTLPVVWECNCLEEVCGACSMIINGKPMQACSALIDTLKQPITLQPLTKFPIIRDLMVDRKSILDGFRQVKAWVEIDGSFNIGPGPRLEETERRKAYQLSLCMSCGCCLEACPNVNAKSAFIGPAALNQARLFNDAPLGRMTKGKRLEAIMVKGGLADCGNAQNCEKVCPKKVPLTGSIAKLNRESVLYSIDQWLTK
ncbi:MAG TPA: succinate dehydrogenase iron-sulfur subunit [Clostridia bacterium]|nr:succinate dehydrogenase iron-sulfur subunit [Clostridia bacterium]